MSCDFPSLSLSLKVHRGVLPAEVQVLHRPLHPRGQGHVLHRARRLLRRRPQPPQVPRGRGECGLWRQ